MTDSPPRVADHPVDQEFLDRWSPRSYTGEAIDEATLFGLLEAARWAPSSYNSQPWRFVYALKGSPAWPDFLELLVPGNRQWCEKAAVLIVVISKETMAIPGKDGEVPSHSHSFDAGAAWAYLALEASLAGWAAHGMIGFDLEAARKRLQVPAGYRIEAMAAIGRRGNKAALPEALQQREAPNGRRPIRELASEGVFKA